MKELMGETAKTASGREVGSAAGDTPRKFFTEAEWKALTPAQREAAWDAYEYGGQRADVRGAAEEEDMTPEQRDELNRRFRETELRARERVQEMELRSFRGNISAGVGAQISSTDINVLIDPSEFGPLFPIGGSTQVATSGNVSQNYGNGEFIFDSVSDPFGAGRFTVFSSDQIRSIGTKTFFGGATTINAIEVTFNSTAFDEDSVVSKESTSLNVKAYIEDSWVVKRFRVGDETGSVSVFGQFAYSNVDQSLEAATAVGQYHTFIYQGINQTMGPDLGLYDPTAFNSPPFSAMSAFVAPVHTVDELVARVGASVDVDQYQFTAGVKLSRTFCRHILFSVSAGPTLKMSDYDISRRIDLQANGSNLATSEFSDSGFDVQFGATLGVGLSADLNSRWSVGANLSVDYTNSTEMGSGNTHAKQGDFSGGFGLGLGYNF